MLETWRFIILWWSAADFCVLQATEVVLIACPSVGRDWYPGIRPQNSPAPYVINVTEEDGRSVHENQFDGPTYGPGQMTYTSKIPLHVQRLLLKERDAKGRTIPTLKKGTHLPHPYSSMS